MEQWEKEDIAKEFRWRVLLAKLPNDAAIARFAIGEAKLARQWVVSNSEAPGSFLWCCDLYDLDAAAVRSALIA
jgi:hypothetical protein